MGVSGIYQQKVFKAMRLTVSVDREKWFRDCFQGYSNKKVHAEEEEQEKETKKEPPMWQQENQVYVVTQTLRKVCQGGGCD